MKERTLLYIFIGGGKDRTSVHLKSLGQIRGLNAAGLKAHGYFFTEKVSEREELYDEITLIPLKRFKQERNLFWNRKRFSLLVDQVRDFLESEHQNWDIIFLRHGGNGNSYEALLDLIGYKTFLYVPSNRIRENYCDVKYGNTGSLASRLLTWLDCALFWKAEKRLMKHYFSKIRSVVAFTPEFAKMLESESKDPIHVIYNRDGADTDSVPARSSRVREGEEIKLIFLKGSASAQKWSGLERIIRSIEAYPELKFRLYITGNADQQKDKYDRPFVTLTGRLSDRDLFELIDEVDLGVSNLENYLIHFNETTNLKSRDYFSRGLPFIQSNTMPDIEGTMAESYYHYVPNDDSIIDMNKVKDFALRMRNEVDHPQKMHDFAVEHLDWRVTSAELAKSILEKSRV
jgi:hypothetical protein